MRLNQPHDRMPPLRVPILTKMVVSASVASVLYALLLETTSEPVSYTHLTLPTMDHV